MHVCLQCNIKMEWNVPRLYCIFNNECESCFHPILMYSRRNPMGLIIALDDRAQAAGELFWDDGDSRGNVTQTVFMLLQI